MLLERGLGTYGGDIDTHRRLCGVMVKQKGVGKFTGEGKWSDNFSGSTHEDKICIVEWEWGVRIYNWIVRAVFAMLDSSESLATPPQATLSQENVRS
jgi:hypothetical protein